MTIHKDEPVRDLIPRNWEEAQSRLTQQYPPVPIGTDLDLLVERANSAIAELSFPATARERIFLAEQGVKAALSHERESAKTYLRLAAEEVIYQAASERAARAWWAAMDHEGSTSKAFRSAFEAWCSTRSAIE